MTWVFIIVFVGLGIYAAIRKENAYQAEPPNPHLVCPHCQTKGQVKTRAITRKKGISGGKATGAIMTAGISMAATGLSRKENATHMHCLACNTEWDVA